MFSFFLTFRNTPVRKPSGIIRLLKYSRIQKRLRWRVLIPESPLGEESSGKQVGDIGLGISAWGRNELLRFMMLFTHQLSVLTNRIKSQIWKSICRKDSHSHGLGYNHWWRSRKIKAKCWAWGQCHILKKC